MPLVDFVEQKLIAAILVTVLGVGWLLARISRAGQISPDLARDQVGLALLVIAGMLFLSGLAGRIERTVR
jgi:hypothetical protein